MGRISAQHNYFQLNAKKKLTELRLCANTESTSVKEADACPLLSLNTHDTVLTDLSNMD